VDSNTQLSFQSSVIEFHILFILSNDYFCIYVYFVANQALFYILTSCSSKGKHQVPNNVKNYINVTEKYTFSGNQTD